MTDRCNEYRNPHHRLTEDEVLEALDKSREQAHLGMYKDADEVAREFKLKYEL